MTDVELLTFDRIERARDRMGDRIYTSPLGRSENLSRSYDARLWFKLESLQITGSFKERGALNRLLTLTDEQRARGVVAASAGNHAQGVSLHATRLGVEATIVMPEGTPLMKVARTRRYGGNVVLHGATYDDAAEHAHALCEERGATFVHPFDDLDVMAGQGTIGLEIMEQNPYIQTIIVPIGGGGLASGVAVAVKETNPTIRVIGVQTEAYPSMKAAVAAGHPVELPRKHTIADGIAVRRAGRHTHATIARYVDDIVTVSEEDIASAILLLLEEEKVVAEGAGAAGLAAIVAGAVPEALTRRTAIIVCGGNIDTNLMSTIIERGLVKAGRRARLLVMVPDQPGALAHLTAVLARERANVLEIHHEREFAHTGVGQTEVTVTLDCRGADHVATLVDALAAEEFAVRSLH